MDLIHQENSGLLVVEVDQVIIQDQIQEDLVVMDLTALLHMLVLDLVEQVTIQIAPLMELVVMHFKILEVVVVLDRVDAQPWKMVEEDLVSFSSHILLDK
tara:strand:+ start:491 stop:790 length:300 start_codon:yes stop_codon:yes gene_type:complete